MSSINIIVREATRHDTDDIVRFQQEMALETEGKILDEVTLKNGITAIFDSSEKGFYLVAEVDGNLVGSLLITYEWSDWRNGFMWWIQSAYVLGEYRRRGVFSALYNHLKLIAKEKPSCCGIRLYVEKHNKHAQKTYLSLGMTNTGYEIMEMDFTRG